MPPAMMAITIIATMSFQPRLVSTLSKCSFLQSKQTPSLRSAILCLLHVARVGRMLTPGRERLDESSHELEGTGAPGAVSVSRFFFGGGASDAYGFRSDSGGTDVRRARFSCATCTSAWSPSGEAGASTMSGSCEGVRGRTPVVRDVGDPVAFEDGVPACDSVRRADGDGGMNGRLLAESVMTGANGVGPQARSQDDEANSA